MFCYGWGYMHWPTPKLNEATRKDHFPLPFMDQMLERLAGNKYYCFLDGFSGYFQIPIDKHDQARTTFTLPYGTFAYRRMPFGLCNAPGTFQRCMMAIFHDMIEKTMEVFMDDFSVFGSSFSTCLTHLEKMLKRCEDTNYSSKLGEKPFHDSKARLLRWVLLLQEFDFDVVDTKGVRTSGCSSITSISVLSSWFAWDIANTMRKISVGSKDVIPAEKKILQRREALFLG
ncbi:reverse transcriptase domain-containing protein [Tanacetum coccineum]